MRKAAESANLGCIPREINMANNDVRAQASTQSPDLGIVELKLEVVVVPVSDVDRAKVGSSRVDLQACKLEYSIVSPK